MNRVDTDRHGSERNEPQTIDGATGKVEPTPGAFGKDGRRIDLSNLRDVRIELARVYRQMDAEEIKSTDGTRRAYVLKTIHDVIVSAELEKRIQELEDRQAGLLPGGAAALPQPRLNS
jgi:hypothetical protein